MAPSSAGPIAQECVEAYLFTAHPRRILVLLRPPGRGSIWVPVSGKVEPTDVDLVSALRRELAEETGWTDPVRVFLLDWEVTFDGPDGRRWRLHAYGVELDGPKSPRLSEEHERFDWLPPAEARERLHYEDNRSAVDRLLSILEGSEPSAPPPKA